MHLGNLIFIRNELFSMQVLLLKHGDFSKVNLFRVLERELPETTEATEIKEEALRERLKFSSTGVETIPAKQRPRYLHHQFIKDLAV